MKRPILLLGTVALLAAGAADAEVAFEPWLDLRYRFETVDQEGFDRDAEASTVRTRLALGFDLAEELGGLVEFEDVRAVGPDDYNSTANGKTAYPVVADPENTELNRAWLAWRPRPGTELKGGKQRLILDNARFVGNVGFRQNEQTFDALALNHDFGAGWELTAAHLEQVNRIFGDSHPDPLLARTDVQAELVNVAWMSDAMGLVGYAYLLENEDVPAASTETYGLRWTGRHELETVRSLGAVLEYATQSPYRDGAAVNDADYSLVRVEYEAPRFGVHVARELLQGNGDFGFSTPLATLHAFQGWADVFLATPPDGIEDRHAGISGAWGNLRWQAVYHDFRADCGGADYGRELDLMISHPLPWGVLGKLEYADYDARDFSVDTRKLWLTLERRW